MMSGMTAQRKTKRITVSLSDDARAYLANHADTETGGNVSALIERWVRERQVTESVRLHAAHYRNNPTFWTDYEAELAAGGGTV